MFTTKARFLLCLLTFGVGISAVWIYVFQTQSKGEISTSGESVLTVNRQESLIADVKAPKGDEIQVSIKILKARKAILTVTNKSSQDVFLPYLPGEKNGFAFHTNIDVDRKNELIGVWENARESHLATGLHALAPGESFKDLIWVSKKGLYKVNVNYVIDRKVLDEIDRVMKIENIEERLKEFDKNSTQMDLAGKIVTTTPFKL